MQSYIGLEFEFYSKVPYNKLLELLNIALRPARVWGFRQYHSGFSPDADNFKIEPDFSGGPDMVELVTGPMPYPDAKVVLIRALRFISQYGYTDEHCSVHINVSFDKESGKEVANLNSLALLLDFDEDVVYKEFPGRRNNIYAKSIKRIIPFEGWDDADAAVNVVSSNLHLPGDTKYYGINLQKKDDGWLEFRYVGGKDYEKMGGEILELADYFVLSTWGAIGMRLNGAHTAKLHDYLEKNITALKNFRSLDTFLSNYPKIDLRVDKQADYDSLNNSYDRFYKRLFDLLHKCNLSGTATINFDSTINRVEVLHAVIEGIFDVAKVDLIECELKDVHVRSCEIVSCNVHNSHVLNSNVIDSDVYSSRVISCNVQEDSVLSDCYFMAGNLDGRMINGVFRSGTVGPNGDISKETKTLTAGGFWNLPKDVETKKDTETKTGKPYEL